MNNSLQSGSLTDGAQAGHAMNWAGAFKLARREAREGLSGFRIFALALILGVFAIAAVGSVSAAFLQGLKKEQLRLAGGQVEVSTIDKPFTDDILQWFEERGSISIISDAQLMVHRLDRKTRSVVQLKSVDQAYPLLGEMELSVDNLSLDNALAATSETRLDRDETPLWGAVADQALFDKLGVKPGGRITIGAAIFEMRAAIEEEPDRASAGFLLSPRLMVSNEGAKATGLLERSGLVRHLVRINLFEDDIAKFRDDLEVAFPDNSWRVRSSDDTARGLANTLENLDVFLTMVGLAALVIGGVGAANAVRAYMQRKMPVIATLKCLGATGDFILKTYAIQVLMVACFAVVIGVAFGAMTPFLVANILGNLLPFKAIAGVYPLVLLKAGAFGILAALVFALWPLAQARLTPPAQLFRSLIESDRQKPAWRDIALVAFFAIIFFALAILLSKEPVFAFFFALSGFAVYGVLRVLAFGFVRGARRFWHPKKPATRLAVASLTREGTATPSVTVSIGMGLTLLAVISLIDANLSREIRTALPDRAPGLFFSDIDFDQAQAFDDILGENTTNADYERFFMMRSGIKLLNGKPLSSVEGAERSGWARQNDWGVSIMARIPEALGTIVAGERWPLDYQGPPLISLSDGQAERFQLEVGDTMTLSIAGRDVTAEIATLHDVNWDRGGINFVAIFAPGTLEAARPTSIGSVRINGELEEDRLVEILAQKFPDVSVIRTREVTASIADIIDNIGLLIRALSGVTIAAGVIVLLGAVAADFRRKLHDAMIMKAVGADRKRILSSYFVEYSVLGFVPAFAAMGLGAIGSWFVVAQRMELNWQPTPMVLLAIVFGACFLTLTIGMAAAWRTLDTRPWPVLRSD